jgi:enoyl-CoA hydratase/carnithine racemase
VGSGRSTTRCAVSTRFRVATVPIEQVVTVSLPGSSSTVLWEALTAAGRNLTGATRVVVLRGEAAGFFGSPSAGVSPDEPPVAAIEWLSHPDVITIAVMSGRVNGVGLDAALACDLRVVADGAQLAPSRSVGSVARLGELMGYSRALAFLVAGATISGQQAAASGLANLSVESQMLDAAVAEMVAAVLRTPREEAIVAKAVLLESASDRRRLADELVEGLRLAAAESP